MNPEVLKNKIRGRFLGPGVTGESHYIEFEEPIAATFITIRKYSGSQSLHVNGVELLKERSKDYTSPSLSWGEFQGGHFKTKRF